MNKTTLKSVHAENHRHYATIEQALLFIDKHQRQQPSLKAIAEHCAMSEYHFQRVFKQWAGVSPKQFLQCLTREHALSRLIGGDTLTASAEHSGLSTNSRLHDLLIKLEAVSPGDIKREGAGITFHCGIHSSLFGTCFIAVTDRGIHRLDFIAPAQFQSQLEQLQLDWPKANIKVDSTRTEKIINQLFHSSTKKDNNTLTLWVNGSQFQLKVWEALLRIPSGSVCSYSAIATAIGKPLAARATASAIAKNSIAILIPCHRVIQQIGDSGQYRWGEQRKKALLAWEAL
jgi:AraC family transcriptional regulator of adaptative response/methylated-DNA-[protein]-cysteine methyltransferase